MKKKKGLEVSVNEKIQNNKDSIIRILRLKKKDEK